MFKFFENSRDFSAFIKNLTENSSLSFSDSYYRYSINEHIININVNFPFMQYKYTFIYDTKTKDFEIQPNDHNLKKGSRNYRKLQDALAIAEKAILNQEDFYEKVKDLRVKCAHLVSNESSSFGNDSKGSRKSNGLSKNSCNPFERDIVWSASDDSDRGSSNSSRSDD